MKDPRPIVGLFRHTTPAERLRESAEVIAKLGKRVGIFGYQANPGRAASVLGPEIFTEMEAAAWARANGEEVLHGLVTKAGEVFIRELRGKAMATSPRLFPGPIRVDCFVAAAGGALVAEIEPFLCAVRAFHSEPIFLFCDEAGANEAERVAAAYGFQGVTVWPAFDEAYSTRAEEISVAVARHAARFNVAWIHGKIEAVQRAMDAMPEGAGVMLLDTDVILAGPIAGQWDADMVLSPHFTAHPEKRGDRFAGYWNAGFMLLRGRRIADAWMDHFLAGEGGFYEQKCLERLSVEFVTDTFSLTHNAGFWREEDFATTGRRPLSIHCHLDEIPPPNVKPFQATFQLAHRAANFAKSAAAMPHRKVAFVHMAKHAGSYVSDRVESALSPRGLQVLNSWHNPPLNREWEPAELSLILKGGLWGMRSNPAYYVRAHQWTWSAETIAEARRRGWFTFSFLRDPLDAICSAYHFHKSRTSEDGRGRVWWAGEGGRSGAALDAATTLAEGCAALISEPDLVAFWAAPEWLEELDFVRPFSPGNLAALGDALGVTIEPGDRLNVSGSAGFEASCAAGLIPAKLAKAMKAHPEVKRIRRLMDSAR